MPRVVIDLPETFLFQTEIPIRIDDINYGNHLGNPAVLALAQEARMRWLSVQGWTELDVAGVGMIQVDAAVIYRTEGRYGMVLRVELAATEIRTRGCDLLYRLTDVATGQEIARVKTGLFFFDYAARKVVHMPAPFRALLRSATPAASPG